MNRRLCILDRDYATPSDRLAPSTPPGKPPAVTVWEVLALVVVILVFVCAT